MLDLVRAFKFNPNHDPKNGRFTTGPAGPMVATEWAAKHKTMKTAEEVLNETLTPEQRVLYAAKLKETMEQVKAGKTTEDLHSAVDARGKRTYSKGRTKTHVAVLKEMLAGADVYAKPERGRRPEFIVLGGRGGSGKSGFEIGKSSAGVYDKKKAIVINADDFKAALAKKDGHDDIGHRAYLYHEESSYLSKIAIKWARRRGLNVVLDITLASDKRADAKKFIKKGYDLKAYYMHLPADKAFRNALNRAKGKDGKMTGRLVSSEVIGSMAKNESNFDKLIPLAKEWKLFSNDVERGADPVLVAQSNVKRTKFDFSSVMRYAFGHAA